MNRHVAGALRDLLDHLVVLRPSIFPIVDSWLAESVEVLKFRMQEYYQYWDAQGGALDQ